jgi:hypothetical protein
MRRALIDNEDYISIEITATRIQHKVIGGWKSKQLIVEFCVPLVEKFLMEYCI